MSSIPSLFKSDLIFHKYKIQSLISKGSFGEVFLAKNILNNKNYAVKIEEGKKTGDILKDEAYALITLKGIGIPSMISYGTKGKYNILIQNLLGKSIYEIYKEHGNKLNLKDTCMLAIQAIERIEFIHSKNYLHRDIKPANFLLGNPNNYLIYLIDFGNARKFRSSRTGKHIKNIKNCKLFGTLIFLSNNCLKRLEQSRKDDLESLGYMLIYLYAGELPWSHKKFMSITEALDKICELRSKINLEMLCKNAPQGIYEYMKYVNKLNFEKKPDYEYLKSLFENMLNQMNEKNDGKFSWIDKNCEPRKISYKSRDNSLQKLYKNLLKINSKSISISPTSKMELSSFNYKYNKILSKDETNESPLNTDSNNFNKINNNIKKKNIIENTKGKETIDIMEKNIKKVHIEDSLNKKNNDNNNKNKGNIQIKKGKFCNVIKITKSKYPKNLNISNNNFSKKIILENNIQTASNITTYQTIDDKINYLHNSELKKLSILNFRNEINLKRMPKEYYQYKSLFKRVEPLKKIKIKKNNIKNIKKSMDNFRIKTFKSYNDFKSYTLLNSGLVKEINNRMNLYNFKSISKINRIENIIQYNPKLIKKVEFQGSKTPLNSMTKKNAPIFMNQSKYKYNLGLVNKRNINQSYKGFKTNIYNYNSKFYPSRYTFNSSPININYYQFK